MIFKNKIPLIVILTIVSLIIVLYAISSTIVMEGFSRVEENNTRQNVDRAVDALLDDIAELDGATKDWATWDETYAFIQDTNYNYTRSYLYDDEFGILRVNLVSFINSSGGVVYSKSIDLEEMNEINVSIDPKSFSSQHLRSNFSGIILLPEGPMLIAGRPILTSEGKGPSRGTLIMGRFLNTREIKHLADLTQLSLSVSEFTDPDMPSDIRAVSSSFEANPSIIVRPLNDSIAGYSIVRDIYGNPALIMRIDIPRSIYEQGRTSLNYFLLSLLIIGMVFGGGTGLLLKKLMITQSLADEREENYLSLMETSPDGVVISDIQGNIINASQRFATLTGYESTQEIRGKNALDFVPPSGREHAEKSLKNVFETGFIRDEEFTILRKDCSLFPIELTSSLIRDAKGEPRSMVTVIRDITVRKQIEGLLRSSEEHFRSLIETSFDIIMALRPDGTILYMSPSVKGMLGYMPEYVIGKNALDFIHPDDAPEVLNVIKKSAQAPGPAIPAQFRVRHNDGTWRIQETVGKTIMDESGVTLIVNMRDITERKAIEKRQQLILQILALLNQSEEKIDTIRNILFLIKDFTQLEAVGIRLKDGEDYPYYETAGFKEDFVEAERYLCARDSNNNLILDQTGRPMLECLCGSVIHGRINHNLPCYTETGSFWSNRTSELLANVTEKDIGFHIRGRCIRERYESLALIPLRSGNENIGLLQLNDHREGMFTLDLIKFFEFVGVSIGIAMERKRVMDELKKHRLHLEELVSERTGELLESEAKYRTLYESSSDAIMLLDEKGFFDCNNATLQMFGFSDKEDFTKVHPADVSPPYQPDGKDSFTLVNDHIQEAFRKGMIRFEWVHRRSNGENFPAEVLLTAFLLGGKPVLQATVRDITERKRDEEALRMAKDEAERASLAKTNFLQTMSHELRTPLNAILGFSELLKQKSAGDLNEKQERFIENIINGSNNLNKIISQILDVVKMDNGTTRLHFEKISVPETLQEFIGIVKEKADAKNVVLEKILDPQLEYLEADKQKFKQVFLNLLENAVKFSKEGGGTVTITAKKESDMAEFSVSDTGIGIREEDVSKLFKEFTQLESGTTRKYGGSGIGLAIAKKFVEFQGGKITVKSKFGEGSTFTFTLPLVQKER